VEPVGVGEVLVVAGQSYADSANDELLKVDDPQGRVAAYDRTKNSWRVAHDPQPNIAPGGTIWPPLGDLLLPLLQVPVGFLNVAVGGTASRQWLPGGPPLAWMLATEVPADHPFVAALLTASEQVLGCQPKLSAFPGGTDAAKFQALAGIPTIPSFGPGWLMLAHGPNECVGMEAILQAAKMYSLATQNYLS
jgi:hypothetical protein